MSKKLTEAELKESIGYRVGGICCGNCKHKSIQNAGTVYNKDLIRCAKFKLDVSDTSLCDSWQNWRSK